MSNINLLPWRVERIIQQNYVLGAIGVFVGIVVILMVILLNLGFKILISNKQKDLEYLKQEIELFKVKTKEINGLKERKKILLKKLEVINALQAQRSVVIDILQQIAISVPSGILLKSIKYQEGILDILGNSESNSRISILMRNLEKSSLFLNPRLKEIKSSQDKTSDQSVSFEIEINIARYTHEKD